METLKKYIKEIGEDLKLDEFNLKEASMLAPSKKHYWVAKLINHKIELEELKTKKNRLIKNLIKKAEEVSPVKLNKVTLEKTVEETDEVEEINKQIKEQLLIIELLEKSEKTFSNFTYSIKNAIDITTMEQM
jgi:hypothetical protein